MDSYVEFGFTRVVNDGVERTQCMTCHTILGNSSLKPSLLKTHQERSHPGLRETLPSLEMKRARYDQRGTLPTMGVVPLRRPLLHASYNKVPHTMAEKLVKPCAIKMVELVLGKDAATKLPNVPLSNDVISSRVIEMSSDVLDQVITLIKASSFRVNLQLDESTDVGNMSQLIIFVRFVKAGLLVDEFLCCRSLPLRSRAVDIFEVVDALFQHHSISWNKVGSLCTDGPPSMLGHRSGFTALVKKRAPHVITYHCILRRHALDTRTLPIVLKAVLHTAVRAVNFIRGSSLNHRLFKAFCNEMGTEHQVLIFLTEVPWLSRGRVLTRVSELH